MNFGIQVVVGQEKGDYDCMEEGDCEVVEMSQRLLRPEALGTGDRLDLNSWGGSHTPYKT